MRPAVMVENKDTALVAMETRKMASGRRDK